MGELGVGRVDGADVHGIHVVAREHLVVRLGDRNAVPVGELTRPDAVARAHGVQDSVFGVRQRREEVTRDDVERPGPPSVLCRSWFHASGAGGEAHAQGMPRSVTADPSQSPAPP